MASKSSMIIKLQSCDIMARQQDYIFTNICCPRCEVIASRYVKLTILHRAKLSSEPLLIYCQLEQNSVNFSRNSDRFFHEKVLKNIGMKTPVVLPQPNSVITTNARAILISMVQHKPPISTNMAKCDIQQSITFRLECQLKTIITPRSD